MFDPTGYKTYRYHSTMLYIDVKATITDVKKACPLFFQNARRGERRVMYKGHIICSTTETFSDRIPQRMITTYAFDVRQGDTNCIDTNAKSIEDAKEIIRAKLEGEPNPLTLSYEEVELTVPVKVRAAIFRDANGKTTQVEPDEFLHVGSPDQIQQKLPGDTFCTEVWSRLPRLVREKAEQTPA